MKTYDETVKSVFNKSVILIKEKKKKKKKAAVVSVCFVLVAFAAFTCAKIIINNANNIVVPEVTVPDMSQTEYSSESIITENNSVSESSNATEEEQKSAGQVYASQKSSDTDIFCDSGQKIIGESSYFFIPLVPQGDVIISGNAITDEDAKLYFDENTSVFSALLASGVNIENIRISEKGYCHVSYSGLLDEKLTVKLDYRDYLVYCGSELVSVITLFRDENGEIHDSPAFGSPAYPQFSSFLDAHRGEKLVFVYAKSVELIITPDNNVYNFLGGDSSRCFEGIENPYERFYNENAVYVP